LHSYNSLIYRRYLVPVHTSVLLLRPEARHRNLTGTLKYAARPKRGGTTFKYEVIPCGSGPSAISWTVMGTNPSQFKAVAGVTKEDQKRFPVESVSWDEAQAFVKLVNEQVQEAGWEYRLPTEEEWEYACRGGPMADKADSAFDYYLEKPTTELQPGKANVSESGMKRTCKVGSYAPNRLGLYDMHGNVQEWCDSAVGTSRRVRRGGCWFNSSVICRAADRDVSPPSSRRSSLGVRLVRASRPRGPGATAPAGRSRNPTEGPHYSQLLAGAERPGADPPAPRMFSK